MKKIALFVALGLALGAVSCTKQEVGQDKGMGMLSMDVELSGQTRAFTEAELYNTAKVYIYKQDYSGLVRSYDYSAIPSPMYLAADSYRVDVIAGEAASQNPARTSWENKSYKGSQNFNIVAGKVTDVQVVAGITNAVTRISFDQTIAENFNAGYSMTVSLDTENAALVYDASKSGKEGYFIVSDLFEPSLTWTFTGTLAKDGSMFTKSGVIENVLAGKLYDMCLRYTIKDGDLDLTLTVDRTTVIMDDTIVFDPVSTGLSASSVYEIWAAHATIHADVDASESEGKTVRFAYSSNGSSWSYADGVNDSEGTWKADLIGLTPSTEYTYKLMIDDVQVGDPMTFTTEAAPDLPNASFEYASTVAGASYYKFYDPDCGVEEGSYMFWGSGNGEGSEGVEGSGSLNVVITYIDRNDKVDGAQSVKAQTSSMVGMLAAGNLFTGQFMGLVGTSGGKVNFGRPWTSRPTALKLWCKYSTGKINIIKNDNLGVTSNDYDRAQIKIAIGTWDYKKYKGTKESPIHINTTDPTTFVDFNTDASTIACGDIIIHNDGYILNGGAKVTASTNGWVEYTIPLQYHNLNAFPTHIVVSCASSQFGDYFTGYDAATLWLDKFELIYE